jgi:hypothetical protein
LSSSWKRLLSGQTIAKLLREDAMASQLLIFTPLPAGISADGRDLLVNLHVSPRLTVTGGGEAPLSDWAAIVELAQTMNSARISILIDGQVLDSERIAEADGAVWRALFPPATPVRTRKVEDFTNHKLLSYPLAALAQQIEGDYLDLAAMDSNLPVFAKLKQLVDYRPVRGVDIQAATEILAAPEQDKRSKEKSVAIALLAAYHKPLSAEDFVSYQKKNDKDPHENTKYLSYKRVPLPRPEDFAKMLDFHDRVSAMGQHPALMQLCGLVIPLRLNGAATLEDGTHRLTASVRWDQRGTPTAPDLPVESRMQKTRSAFIMASSSPLIVEGWLAANDDMFDLVGLDVDGAGISLKNMAASRVGPLDERFDDAADPVVDKPPPLQAGAPRLRSAGLQLAYDRRYQALHKTFARAKAMEQALALGEKITLWAEDVARGWRVEIAHKGGEWRSLMRCDGTYHLVNSDARVQTRDEEAIIRLATGGSADGSNPDVLKLTEAMFAWSGWSLAAPEPGKGIMPDDTTLAEGPNETPPGLPLHVSYTAVPRSLPTLRFGRSYQVRLRLADLAGGGLAHDPAAKAPERAETQPVSFGRYEPVETPILTLLQGSPDPADGESMGRAALRTMDDPDLATKSVYRLIAPPRVAIRFAELHGALDDDQGRPRTDLYSLLADRDKTFAMRKVVTKAWKPDQDVELAPDGDDVVVEFAEAAPGTPAPYLPDPLAAGVALRIADVPGINPAKVHFIPFFGDTWDEAATLDWPNALLFAIRADTVGSFGWDAAKRQFIVPLPAGERARIRVSALLPKMAHTQMQFLRRLRHEKPEAYARLRKDIGEGQHWMFTPWRTLELVHATQRPVVAPQFLGLTGSRLPGQSRARIHISSPVHAKSTLRTDVDATWMEIDDSNASGPRTANLSGPAFSMPYHRLAHSDGVMKSGGGQHALPDSRARRIGYRMVATTRFREYMPFEIRRDATGLSRDSERQFVWVPSSSPPAAPSVRYVVPTFGWTTSGDGNRVWRRGGGLRVWLDRPWFGSGANEMLAVLLPRGTSDPQTSDAKNYVTQWGSDPVWPGRTLSTLAPPRSAFLRGVNAGAIPVLFSPAVDDPSPGEDAANPPVDYPVNGLKPQGAPQDLLVDAVPHAVGYDTSRKLWYCDIVINPGEAYFPFIRLALARYQPASLPGMHLSSVAMASFQQLAPDRVATVLPMSAERVRVEVRGHGQTPPFTRPLAGRIDIRLQRLKAGKDESLDWEDTPERDRPDTAPDPGDLAPIDQRAPRRRLSPQIQARITTALSRLEAGDLEVLTEQPDIVDYLLPPLLKDLILWLPARGGDRLRVLVTEREEHSVISTDGKDDRTRQERIVYAAAIEV